MSDDIIELISISSGVKFLKTSIKSIPSTYKVKFLLYSVAVDF
jgi:hypothetical protein